MFTNIAYIALGSNKGDRLSYLSEAVSEIQNNSLCNVEAASSVYETLPFGNKNQPDFFNAVIRIGTNYKLLELLSFLKETEKKIGRVETFRWGPREIDLDMLFYNDTVYSDEKITIPHKGIAERDFVLTPLCEIAPELIHPVLNKKICDICIPDNEKNVKGKIPGKIF